MTPSHAAPDEGAGAKALALSCAVLPLLVLPAAIALVDSPWLWLVPPCVLLPIALADEWLPAREDVPLLRASGGGVGWGDVWLALYLLQLPLFLALALATLASGPGLAQASALLVVTALLFGVAYNVAHDLIHRMAQPLRWWSGYLLLMLVGDAQLSISHVYSHHPQAATHDDPASARLGESLYAFVVRSTAGQYAAAWRFETRRLRGGAAAGTRLPWWRHRVLLGVLGTGLLWAGSLAAFGLLACGVYVAACVIGKFLFESANYIQHYGLSRQPGEKVGPQHSWDCLAPASRIFMFNQNHHADHHLRANRRCWELAPAQEAPRMPHGYLRMLALATLPPWWFRTMDERAVAAASPPASAPQPHAPSQAHAQAQAAGAP